MDSFSELDARKYIRNIPEEVRESVYQEYEYVGTESDIILNEEKVDKGILVKALNHTGILAVEKWIEYKMS